MWASASSVLRSSKISCQKSQKITKSDPKIIPKKTGYIPVLSHKRLLWLVKRRKKATNHRGDEHFSRSRKTNMQVILRALCAACVSLYASPLLDRTREWEFLGFWDDETNFVTTEMVRGLTWKNLYAMFTTQRIHVYEPLGFLLKAIQFQFGGGGGFDPWKIRYVTLVLHFAACAVLMKCTLLLHNILRLVHQAGAPTSPNSHPRRSVDGCLLATTLYVIHPVTIEVVAWPSAQPYALAALFSTLSMYFYFHDVRDRLQPETGQQDEGTSSITRKVPFIYV